ncbi:hypothetical protein DACRYDRAFT_22098 [Dacryopinax primogenitus]|uniref:Lipid droplet-associated perilipin protein n=1 Tax=Dacryopinax primogenitus (strain DJM 731) TaxID=1858805 RepID=M5G153_DACPD|nr:uncharacterized protein DACRYDRAFT_22098 [Dacryopinax primogenitus]EJU02464.1 hypothetical protein DACRYDRAFT_22098 [Dacryopinax primogenitus]
MSVDTEQAPATPTYPEVKSFHRLASVPIVHDSFASLDALLARYPTTNNLKLWAQAWGNQAYKIGEPYGARLSTVIVTADGVANQGLDVLQRHFPYPFIAPTDEIISNLRAPADHAYTTAASCVGAGQKAVNDRVIAPAIGAAEGVDKTLSPYLDSLEASVRLYVPPRDAANGAEDHSKPTHVRAYELTLDARARAISLTQEQFSYLQEHSVLLQRASTTVASLTTAAKEQSQALVASLLHTLDNVQQTTAKLPGEVQHALQPFSDRLTETYKHMLEVSHEKIPLPEKTKKLAGTAQEGLTEVLGLAVEKVQQLVGWVKVEAGKKQEQVNGNAHEAANGARKVGGGVKARKEKIVKQAQEATN